VFLFNLCKDETNKDLEYYVIFKRLDSRFCKENPT
jgi:hypothetical protein